MNKNHIKGLTIATVDMDKMVNFYTKVFGVEFTSIENYGIVLYQGKWGELDVLFCPTEIAGISATENRHQFDVVVEDLDHTVKVVEANGGQLLQEVTETETGRSVGIYDPDKNSIVLMEVG